MNLNTGKVTTPTNWTITPMPHHVITRLHNPFHLEPIGLNFRDRNNQAILHEEHAHDDGDDETYVTSDDNSEDNKIVEYESDIEDNYPATGMNNQEDLQFKQEYLQSPKDIPGVGELETIPVEELAVLSSQLYIQTTGVPPETAVVRNDIKIE